jgi:hypothetical protein
MLIGGLTASGMTSGDGAPTVGTKVGLGAIDPQAVCNDGSEAAYYFAEASDPAKTDIWLIWLQGGDMCQEEEACLARAKNSKALTSSEDWPETLDMAGVTGLDDPAFGGCNKAGVE